MAKLKILLLIDITAPPPPNHDYKEWFAAEDWTHEARLLRVLKELGHDASLFGLYDNIDELLETLKKDPPDLIFNQCEAIHKDRRFEPHVASLLEMLGIPFTGAGSEAIQLCKNKALTKKILAYHGIRIPAFMVSEQLKPLKSIKDIPFPVFVKPLALEGSEGIALSSFAENEKDALDRVAQIQSKYECDVIIEEFVQGKELYVGVLGNRQLTVLPTRELYFGDAQDVDEPTFATFKVKWDDVYRAKRKIMNRMARGVSDEVTTQLESRSKEIYRILKIQGLGRMDFRLTPSNELVFLEANPNPSIVRDDDFSLAAEKHGLSYAELIERIIALGVERGK